MTFGLFLRHCEPQSPEYNDPAQFEDFLTETFSKTTMHKVKRAFAGMGLPLPDGDDECVRGTHGLLGASNILGVMWRVERDIHHGDHRNTRKIDDSVWVQTPLHARKAGRAALEICAGGKVESDPGIPDILNDMMKLQRLDFVDLGTRNVVRLPITTPGFPSGIPVVCDRLSVRRLSRKVQPIKTALEEEAAAAITAHYSPLMQAFARGAEDPRAMPAAWRLCAEFVREGKLLAGWNDPEAERAMNVGRDKEKIAQIREAAKIYDQKIEKMLSSAGPAIP